MKNNNLILIIITTLILSSCGSINKEFDTTDTADMVTNSEEMYYQKLESDYIDTGYGTTDNLVSSDNLKRETKIISKGYIENRSSTFEETLLDVKKSIKEYNGFFSTSTFRDGNHKNFDGTIKVPVENYNDLFNELKNCGINLNNSSETVNATNGYYSLKSQLEVKKLYVQKLQSLINTAKEPIELLNLYDNYFNAISELEMLESQLQNLDYLSSYSTINFSLNEEKTVQILPVPKEGVLKQVTIGFNTSISFIINSVQHIILFLAYISFPAFLIILLLIISVTIYKKKFKN